MNNTEEANQEYRIKLKRLSLLKAQQKLRDGLPHLYGQPFYDWSRAFFESTNRYTFLCSGNQVGKSSVQIRKCIHWATEPKLWPKLWKQRPMLFWYLYPTRDVSMIEIEKKWIPQFLPRGLYKDDSQYGWELEYRHKFPFAIHFRTGVSIYFRTYSIDVSHLQTGTVHALFLDEELPENLFDELNMRIAATEGYFHMAFTATLGQEFWRQTIEERGRNERFKDACKIQVSMYDCIYFEDGTPSHWTRERIEAIENSCRSPTEVQKRIHGRFIKDDEGLKYQSFRREVNVKPAHPLPATWNIYVGVDVGSGGDKGHPAAIVFVAVSPEFQSARVFKGWRGDGILTTASDVFQKFKEMKGNMVISGQYYDWASKDFQTIAARLGESFQQAEKSHAIGEQVLNTLFKTEMLIIYDIPELKPLVEELCNLEINENKNSAKDDYIDALRYACTRIPWDWNAIERLPIALPTKEMSKEESARRGVFGEEDPDLSILVDDELDSWNELYDA